VDVFLLGAGRPAHGQKPSALKHIALNTKAMDWQVHSFESTTSKENIHYLGGYHVSEVIDNYPQLNFTVVPDWFCRGVLHTLLKAPFNNCPAIVTYSDTVFRSSVIREISSQGSDVVYGVDSSWLKRYSHRSDDDISSAETVNVPIEFGGIAEFTGLLCLSEKAVQHLKGVDETSIGSSLLDLLAYFEKKDLVVSPFDVSGGWAELNSPRDIARFILGTKADTLARLKPIVKKCHIGKQVTFTSDRWIRESQLIVEEIHSEFLGVSLVVRSSSEAEDGWLSSNAGGFESVLNVDGSSQIDISVAIDSVIASYGESGNGEDQVLIQECLHDVQASGVVFTCGLETGSPYYRFNFDDKSSSTDSVTGWTSEDIRTVILSKFNSAALMGVEPSLVPVLEAVEELEQLLGFDKLDIEFAIDCSGEVHLFQVRPITVDHSKWEVDLECVEEALIVSAGRFESLQPPSSFCYGEKTLFANMPDWNPAEIIGVRPKALAFSLYRELITDEIWARQRFEFGYRDVRPCPLIYSFVGQPYVDVRASLNSFIPASLGGDTARVLANAYIDIISDNPAYHDKVEFEVAFTVWVPGFIDAARKRLIPYGVSESDLYALEESLKEITCNALTRLPKDIDSVTLLERRRKSIVSSNVPVIDKVISLLDDCRSFGTLAFSHAARSGFIATSWLKSLVSIDVLSEERVSELLRSFSTVAGEFEVDKQRYFNGDISLDAFVGMYGHLRPGTYEVSNVAYWEDPVRYMVSGQECRPNSVEMFELSSVEAGLLQKALVELGLDIDSREMVEYIIQAIQARESTKFEFTKNLSSALDLCVEFGGEIGLTRDDVSYLEHNDLKQFKINAISIGDIKSRVELRKRQYLLTLLVDLPPLIDSSESFYCFERFSSQPNFVTMCNVVAKIKRLDSDSNEDLRGKVILIPQADPGFDWLFACGISGLITKYGGANSHMAIRAAEIGLPAAIGVGDKLFDQISSMKHVELDCSSQTIREVQ